MKKILCALLVFMMVLPVAACSGKEQITLNVLNWGDYIDTAVLKQFEQETGIKVKYTTMTSNEEMIVKLSAADCIYDVCFPSDYIIEKLVQQDLLYEINKDNIPNYSNIDERFLDLPFDPGNKYSVPYFWGTVGILYNTTKVSAPIDSWDALWDEQYKGQILMYDSVRDSIGITLIKLGYNINTRNEAEVMEAQQALIAQKPLVKAYLTDDIKMEMINGNGAMAVVYSGDALACISENPDLAYVVPKEGSNVWFDNIIILPRRSSSSTSFVTRRLGRQIPNMCISPRPTRRRCRCSTNRLPAIFATILRRRSSTAALFFPILVILSTCLPMHGPR